MLPDMQQMVIILTDDHGPLDPVLIFHANKVRSRERDERGGVRGEAYLVIYLVTGYQNRLCAECQANYYASGRKCSLAVLTIKFYCQLGIFKCKLLNVFFFILQIYFIALLALGGYAWHVSPGKS